MSKNLEALLRGYLFFRVSYDNVPAVHFLRYETAREYAHRNENEGVAFEGFHWWCGMVGFFYRWTTDRGVAGLTSAELGRFEERIPLSKLDKED